ncbi:MAG: flagellar basal body P-ring formation protein FlgA [Rhodobacteraceae bacterium]|nr:flagellar basal body P-ring formation protein FlgA [Paracoccaceae bacterium]
MWRVLIFLFPSTVMADSLIATRVIRAQETLVAEAVTLVAADIPGALTDPAQALGQEVRVTIYPGRPVLAENLGPAASVERNQIVALIYETGGLSIRTEGRALARGGEGDVIEVLNLVSKTRIVGRIRPGGVISVGSDTTP